MLEPYIDSYLTRVALIIIGLFALSYPQWLPLIRRNMFYRTGELDSLITRLKALGDQLEYELNTGGTASTSLSRAVMQAATDLDALKIPHPNWHNLSVWPILAWLPYVDKLLPALRRQNLLEARDAINHVDMADGLKP